MRPKKQILVPDGIMIPAGARATKDTGQCADSWSDSQLGQFRASLPTQYHAVPLDWLKSRWITIRKRGTEGYSVNGKGPRKGSRKQKKREPPPKEYRNYLKTEHWQNVRDMVLKFWGYRCCLCNVPKDEAILDVHHRTYERLGDERLQDCVALCRRCHTFMDDIPIDKTDTKTKTLF